MEFHRPKDRDTAVQVLDIISFRHCLIDQDETTVCAKNPLQFEADGNPVGSLEKGHTLPPAQVRMLSSGQGHSLSEKRMLKLLFSPPVLTLMRLCCCQIFETPPPQKKLAS
jgi:hypothetical protein